MNRVGEKADGRVVRAQRQRESRRAAVLAAARKVFAKNGYHQTSIDDLIEAAGIARGTFYLYFESKRAIFDELLEELFVTLQGSVRRIDIGPSAPPPVVQMNETVERVLETLLRHRELASILLREAVGIDADFDRKLGNFYGRLEALIMSAVETGQQMGLVRRCEARVVARCILGSVKEVVHFAFVEKDPAQLDLSGLGRELIAFSLKGLFVS
jgi:AcrR family transcriptional regulator